MRIVTIDIETSPLESYTWGLFDQNVGLNQIKTEWAILSFAAKWLGDENVIYEDTFHQRNKLDDRKLLKRLWKILDEADIVIAQNGKKFDIRKINARFLLAGLPPYSPIKVIDTMLEARKNFALTSNRLEWLSTYLASTQKRKHEEFPGFELWREYLRGNPRAAEVMKLYNIDDVISTEEVYMRIRPWITGHPNMGAYDDEDGEIEKCPNCGGYHVVRKGTRTTQVGVYARYRCSDCGAWSRGRVMLNSKAHRKTILVN